MTALLDKHNIKYRLCKSIKLYHNSDDNTNVLLIIIVNNNETTYHKMR